MGERANLSFTLPKSGILILQWRVELEYNERDRVWLPVAAGDRGRGPGPDPAASGTPYTAAFAVATKEDSPSLLPSSSFAASIIGTATPRSPASRSFGLLFRYGPHHGLMSAPARSRSCGSRLVDVLRIPGRTHTLPRIRRRLSKNRYPKGPRQNRTMRQTKVSYLLVRIAGAFLRCHGGAQGGSLITVLRTVLPSGRSAQIFLFLTYIHIGIYISTGRILPMRRDAGRSCLKRGAWKRMPLKLLPGSMVI